MLSQNETASLTVLFYEYYLFVEKYPFMYRLGIHLY
jgi:hypothetical protein